MSDVPNDPTGAAGQEQPSQEEVRQYLEQLRVAPVEQVVAEVASALLNAAQVKLGRQDGRLLIDVVADITERCRGSLPDEITGQLDEALTQLRMAQVEAERDVAGTGAEGGSEGSDAGAGGSSATDGSTSGAGGTTPPPTPPGQGSSRLWVPGR